MAKWEEILASAIESYALGELTSYSYHGDGSAIAALNELIKQAPNIVEYAKTHKDWLVATDQACPTCRCDPHQPCGDLWHYP